MSQTLTPKPDQGLNNAGPTSRKTPPKIRGAREFQIQDLDNGRVKVWYQQHNGQKIIESK